MVLVLKDAAHDLVGDLFSSRTDDTIRLIFTGELSVFFHQMRVQRGGCSMMQVRQTHPLTRPSRLWLGLVWLAHRLHSGAAVSPHKRMHTRRHTQKQNTLLEWWHAHTRFHTTEVCALLIMPVTWKHNKVESICTPLPLPPLHDNTNALFEKEKKRERERGPI